MPTPPHATSAGSGRPAGSASTPMNLPSPTPPAGSRAAVTALDRPDQLVRFTEVRPGEPGQRRRRAVHAGRHLPIITAGQPDNTIHQVTSADRIAPICRRSASRLAACELARRRGACQPAVSASPACTRFIAVTRSAWVPGRRPGAARRRRTVNARVSPSRPTPDRRAGGVAGGARARHLRRGLVGDCWQRVRQRQANEEWAQSSAVPATATFALRSAYSSMSEPAQQRGMSSSAFIAASESAVPQPGLSRDRSWTTAPGRRRTAWRPGCCPLSQPGGHPKLQVGRHPLALPAQQDVGQRYRQDKRDQRRPATRAPERPRAIPTAQRTVRNAAGCRATSRPGSGRPTVPTGAAAVGRGSVAAVGHPITPRPPAVRPAGQPATPAGRTRRIS